jgi:predicted TIM-barrel fold metal-dependent hydrolase
MRKRSDVELPERPPLWLRDHSNGEYYHRQTAYERKLERLIMQKADENARKLGMPRRDFLASAMGMVTSLYCVNLASACSSNETGHNVGPIAPNNNLPKACDAYKFQPEAMFDEQAACAAINGDEFIFDIQTHFFDPNGEWVTTNPGYVNVIKAFAGQDFGMDTYIRELFCQSDTKMAVLSTWPGALCGPEANAFFNSDNPPCGLPMSTEEAAKSRDIINKMAESRRLLNHAMILPNDPAGVQNQLDIMEVTRCTIGVSAWKLYPAWGPDAHGFFVDDPDVGIPVVEKGLELGVGLFCIHKGLPIPGFDPSHNVPTDIGPVAAAYPKAKFVIYHAAINTNGSAHEGEYIDGDDKGVNSLITSMIANGIGPNQNVYAELGSSWRQVMADSNQAAHYIGKLMKYVGEDNICWGTDCIAGAAPQSQIEALRALTIPKDMQDQFGYVELTAERKAKIFGLNSAKIYGVDPTERHCQIDSCQVAQLKKNLDQELGERRWVFDDPPGIKTYEQYIEHGRENIKRGTPG